MDSPTNLSGMNSKVSVALRAASSYDLVLPTFPNLVLMIPQNCGLALRVIPEQIFALDI